MSSVHRTAFPITTERSGQCTGLLMNSTVGLKTVLGTMDRDNPYAYMLAVGQGERIGGRWQSPFEAGAAAVYFLAGSIQEIAPSRGDSRPRPDLYGEDRHGMLPRISNPTYSSLVQPLIESGTDGLERLALIGEASPPSWSSDTPNSVYHPALQISRFHVDKGAFMAGGGLVLAALEMEHAARLAE